MSLNYQDQMEQITNLITSPESILGKGLNQPMDNLNSGSRKTLSSIQEEHGLNLIEPEIPIIGTGYENRFGDYSSSIIEADDDYTVLKKIQKFRTKETKDHHYFLIIVNNGIVDPSRKGTLSILERKCYTHNTESYGYLNDTDVLDSLKVGERIENGEIITRSSAYDSSGNRCDGVNLNTVYLAKSKTMEDAFQISETGVWKLRSVFVETPECNINDNDILLNLYGDDNNYKSFPDINEDIKDGILISTRRERIDDALYMQCKDRLKNIYISDEKYTLHGKVIDIDIKCNNPENLDKYTNVQMKKYYDEKMEFNRELLDSIDELLANNLATKLDNDLKEMVNICRKELNGAKYINSNGKIYSGTMLYFVILEVSIPQEGDKIANRYGGKGVISEVVPDHLMPLMDNGERAEIILDSPSPVNRLNNNQLKELSLTHIGSRIIEMIKTSILTYDEALEMILKYIKLCSPKQAEELSSVLDMNSSSTEFRDFYLETMIYDGNIKLSMKPISESLTIDDIERIYQEFPWATQNKMYVAMQDSNGNYRYVQSRRTVVCGKMFFYRLKQYAKEKFSVTSLSSTNLCNENSRSKANKNFKSVFPNTPVRFGNMENMNFIHMGVEIVKIVMMIYSSSPHARLLVERLYSEDPYDVNINLDSESTDRSAEKLNVNLKTIGLRLEYIKVPKVIKTPMYIKPMSLTRFQRPILRIKEPGFDGMKYIEKSLKAYDEIQRTPMMIQPMRLVSEIERIRAKIEYEEEQERKRLESK